MSKKIVISSCDECPHRDHGGGFATVAYVPICSLANKELPHTVGATEKGRCYAVTEYVIPEWCPLEDNGGVEK